MQPPALKAATTALPRWKKSQPMHAARMQLETNTEQNKAHYVEAACTLTFTTTNIRIQLRKRTLSSRSRLPWLSLERFAARCNAERVAEHRESDTCFKMNKLGVHKAELMLSFEFCCSQRMPGHLSARVIARDDFDGETHHSTHRVPVEALMSGCPR
jgi:hypothetical protein